MWQAFRYSPEKAFYIFNQQIYFIIFFETSWIISIYSSTKCCVFHNVTFFLFRKLFTFYIIDVLLFPNIVRVIKSRRLRWAGYVARMGEGRGVYRVLVGKPEGNSPLGRPRRRWEHNVRIYLQEVGCRCEDWIGLAQDRGRWRALVSAVRNLRVP
jgi:hypothetical protein